MVFDVMEQRGNQFEVKHFYWCRIPEQAKREAL